MLNVAALFHDAFEGRRRVYFEQRDVPEFAKRVCDILGVNYYATDHNLKVGIRAWKHRIEKEERKRAEIAALPKIDPDKGKPQYVYKRRGSSVLEIRDTEDPAAGTAELVMSVGARGRVKAEKAAGSVPEKSRSKKI